jgi:hypothetical protein
VSCGRESCGEVDPFLTYPPPLVLLRPMMGGSSMNPARIGSAFLRGADEGDMWWMMGGGVPMVEELVDISLSERGGSCSWTLGGGREPELSPRRREAVLLRLERLDCGVDERRPGGGGGTWASGGMAGLEVGEPSELWSWKALTFARAAISSSPSCQCIASAARQGIAISLPILSHISFRKLLRPSRQS